MASVAKLGAAALAVSSVLSVAVAEIQVTPIATGLRRPAALALLPDPRGVRVLAFESEPPALLLFSNGTLARADWPGAEQLGSLTCVARLPGTQKYLAGFREPAEEGGSLRVLNLAVSGNRLAVQLGEVVEAVFFTERPESPSSYTSIAAGGGLLYAVLRSGDNGAGLLMRAAYGPDGISKLRPLSTLKTAGTVGAPLAATLSPEGYVAAVFGVETRESESPVATRLLFAAPERTNSAPPPAVLRLDLPNIVAIAYSPVPRPNSRRLYALADGSGGGLYRIDAATDTSGFAAAQATKLVDLTEPTAMVFDRDAALYVADAGSGAAEGRVLKITGDL